MARNQDADCPECFQEDERVLPNGVKIGALCVPWSGKNTDSYAVVDLSRKWGGSFSYCSASDW